MLKNQKGITLIALIITIIVMLILVGVTINVALNGGLFQKADDATKLTQEAADKEELQLEIVTAYNEKEGTVDLNLLKTNLEKRNWKDVTISGDKLTCTSPKGNTFTVTADGKISEGGNDAGSGNQTGSLTDFEKYILGQAGTGRPLFEFDGENIVGGIFNYSEFLDDPETENVDETETLGVEFLTTGINENFTKEFVYAKYDNKVYRVIVDLATYSSERPLEVVYEPQGREGQTTADGWKILYDNGTTVEAVSTRALGRLSLGCSKTATDSATRLTEAIDSYNNAITRINNYCKNELTGLPTNSNVRSVGASSETSDEASNKYTSPNLENRNSAYNGVGKKGDTLFEQDLVRMAYHEVLATGTSYWMASRVVNEDSDYVNFNVNYVYEDGSFYIYSLWDVDASGDANGHSFSYAVRPIITIQNP